MTAYAIDLDAIGDTRPLWCAWLDDAARVLGAAVAGLPEDRTAAAAALDAAGAGNWRTLLERFAEDHAPVFLRPSADASAALRRLAATGAAIAVYSDAPEELVSVAVAHLGAARRVVAVECGAGARERAAAAVGGSPVVLETRDALLRTA